MNGADGRLHRGKAHGQAGAVRGQGKKLQSGFGDDAEEPFGTDEQPREIEAGFVFVRAAAKARHGTVREHDFESEHVITRDAIFEAPRAAGVGGNVAAERAIGAARGVGRIK